MSPPALLPSAASTIAVLGEDDDIGALRKWQAGESGGGPSGWIARDIKQKNVPPSPSCPS